MSKSSLSATATKRFITATTDTSALDLINAHCSTLENPKLLFDVGGVWLMKKRLLSPLTIISKGTTLTVYISSRLNDRFELNNQHIIKETDDWIVVHKPATLSAVPDRSHLFWNMTAAVSAYCQQSSPGYDCQPINRLDWLVEGLMLFSKHKSAEKELFKLSQAKKITKGYLALTTHQTKSILKVKNTLKFKHRAECCDHGKLATTWFLKVDDYNDFSIYRAILSAGKRHQIRFHASLKLSPLVGDYFYNSSYKTPLKEVGLIADSLTFWWKNKRYKINLPQSMTIIYKLADNVISKY